MSKIYCGAAAEPPKGRRFGTLKECMDRNQIRRYGVIAVSQGELEKKKDEPPDDRDKLLIKMAGLNGLLKRHQRALNVAREDDRIKAIEADIAKTRKELNAVKTKLQSIHVPMHETVMTKTDEESNREMMKKKHNPEELKKLFGMKMNVKYRVNKMNQQMEEMSKMKYTPPKRDIVSDAMAKTNHMEEVKQIKKDIQAIVTKVNKNNAVVQQTQVPPKSKTTDIDPKLINYVTEQLKLQYPDEDVSKYQFTIQKIAMELQSAQDQQKAEEEIARKAKEAAKIQYDIDTAVVRNAVRKLKRYQYLIAKGNEMKVIVKSSQWNPDKVIQYLQKHNHKDGVMVYEIEFIITHISEYEPGPVEMIITPCQYKDGSLEKKVPTINNTIIFTLDYVKKYGEIREKDIIEYTTEWKNGKLKKGRREYNVIGADGLIENVKVKQSEAGCGVM